VRQSFFKLAAISALATAALMDLVALAINVHLRRLKASLKTTVRSCSMLVK